MVRDIQQIIDFQKQLNQSQDVLKKLFSEALRAVDADHGFLAFEDTNRRLSILVSEGDFWYLPATEGVTGRCFSSAKPIIADSDDPDYTSTGADVYSEMSVPIYQGDIVVGVILMDNKKEVRFNKHQHVQTVEFFTKQISDAIEQKEPWNFRNWWIGHQRRKHEKLVDFLVRELSGIVTKMEDVNGYIGLLGENGKIGKLRKIGESSTLVSEGTDPIDEVLMSGTSKVTHKPLNRYHCIVPFPLNGPILGVVRLDTYNQSTFSNNTIDTVQSIIKKISYDHLSPAATSGNPDSEYYFNLIHTAFAAHCNDVSLGETLSDIVRQTETLCVSRTRIGIADDDIKAILKNDFSENIYPVTYDALKQQYREKLGTRPRCIIGKEWLRCPIWVGEDVVAIVELEAKEQLDNNFNRPLVEIISELLGAVLLNYKLIKGAK